MATLTLVQVVQITREFYLNSPIGSQLGLWRDTEQGNRRRLNSSFISIGLAVLMVPVLPLLIIYAWHYLGKLGKFCTGSRSSTHSSSSGSESGDCSGSLAADVVTKNMLAASGAPADNVIVASGDDGAYLTCAFVPHVSAVVQIVQYDKHQDRCC